jgi:hypothetical protein
MRTYNHQEALQLEKRIMKACGAHKVKVLAGIKRAPPINPYYTSSGECFLYITYYVA